MYHLLYYTPRVVVKHCPGGAATELARFFGLARTTMPHRHTWSRIFGDAVAIETLEAVVRDFFVEQIRTAEVPTRGSIVLASDGKTLRGTSPAGQTRGVHLVAAELPEQGVVLAQLAVDQKANESIPHRYTRGAVIYHRSPCCSLFSLHCQVNY